MSQCLCLRVEAVEGNKDCRLSSPTVQLPLSVKENSNSNNTKDES